MTIDFTALSGSVNIDPAGMVSGLDRGSRALEKFTQETYATFESIAAASGRSLAEVTSAAQDLAEVMGTDTHSAALLLAESLNDPTVGLELLTKAGVEFTESQRQQITELTESGRVFEAQGAVLDVVRERYDAAATAADALAQSAAEAANAPVPDVAAPAAAGGASSPLGLSPGMLKGAAVMAVIHQAVQAYGEAELAAARYGAVQEATGNATQYTLQQLQELAAGLQESAKIEDDAVVAAGSFLATLKTIQGVNFERTIRSSADLAAAMGTDIRGAAELLGRALADPEQGMTRLTRAGIYLTDQQKEQVKAFMATNDVAKAQAVILDVVDGKVGGVADKLGGTFAKQVEHATIMLSEALEELGRGLADLNRETGVIDTMVLGLKGIGGAISLITNGISGLAALIKGDMQGFEVYANRLTAKLLDLRAWLAEATGGKAHAEILRAQADSYRQMADSMEHVRNKQLEINAARAKGASIPAPSVVPGVASAGPAMVQSTSSGSSAATGPATAAGPSYVERQRTSSQMWRDAQAAQDFAATEQGSADLASQGTEGGRRYVSALAAEIKDYAANGGLKFDFKTMSLDSTTQADIDSLLAKYRAMASQMPGFNADAWNKIEQQTQQALQKAAKSTGEQRDLYLTMANSAVESATKMFDEVDKVAAEKQRKIDEAKQRADAIAKTTVAPQSSIDSKLKTVLGGFGRSEALEVFKGFGADMQAAIAAADGKPSIENIERISEKYRLMFQEIDGYSSTAFRSVHDDIIRNMTDAANVSGAAQKILIDRAVAAASDGTAVFAKKVKRTEESKPTDEYAAMQTASRNQLQAQYSKQKQGLQNAMQFEGMSPQQRAGFKALSNDWSVAMRKVRDSTGDARKANIEELRVINEAWAKAYQAIREGSKKTVEQLVADAKKEGSAGKQSATERAMSAKEKRQNTIAARQADEALMGGNPLDQISNMSVDISNMFNGALSGIGQGAAMLAQIMNQTTDPMAKLGLEMGNVSARLAAATLNAQTFGGGVQQMIDLQKELAGLQKKEMDIRLQQSADRLEAEQQRSESYKQREIEKTQREIEQRREAGYDIASAITVGSKPGPTMHFYGIHDAREMVNQINSVLKTNGYNRGISRTLDTK